MSLPYEKLTQILGDLATEHTPESETTPEFMNGKFDELLVNDKYLYNQINVLNYQELPSTITALSDLNSFGKWVCKGNAQAVNLTDLPLGNYSFIVENIPTVWNTNGSSANTAYCVQRLTYYKYNLGMWERYNNNGVWSGWHFVSGQLSTTYSSLLNGWTLPWTSYKFRVSRNGNNVTLQGVLGIGVTTTDTEVIELPNWAKSKALNVIVVGENLTTVASGGSPLAPFKFRVSTAGKLVVQSNNNLTAGSFGINASYEGVDL